MLTGDSEVSVEFARNVVGLWLHGRLRLFRVLQGIAVVRCLQGRR